ncbi:MAG: dipeptidase [Bdellovibrionota bacterium]
MQPVSDLKTLFAAFDSQRDELLKEYFDFLRFKSVSAEPEFKTELLACCDWVVAFLEEAGMSVEVWPTSGHPMIFASWTKAGPSKPTVMIYNHYDVQPVDPIELWKSPPFEPETRDGEVYARGAQDNKGQCFYVISAVRWLLKTKGALPVNLKLVIEGEEETGSAGIAAILESKKEQLKADSLFIVDLGLHEKNAPALTLGVRGIVTMTVELRGSNSDLHSGMVGGIVYNPNRAMVELLAKLYDSSGRVAIPGFYDNVAEPSAEELKALSFTFDEARFKHMFEAAPVGGEREKFTAMQRAWIRPTLEINGIGGGYTGDGFKTVIPGKTLAKLSCRLVPNQDPEKIARLVSEFLENNTPPGMSLQITLHPGTGEAVRTDFQSHPVQVTAKVMSEVFERPCEYILSGGSIPIVADLSRSSGAEVVLMGLGLPDDNLHAPNEHFGIDRIRAGFVTMAAVIERLA